MKEGNDEKRLVFTSGSGFGQALKEKYVLPLWVIGRKLQELSELVENQQ
jgi:hypothetical protein